MALSEYVLLVSLSAGIPAHADTHDISIGHNVITQSNGGAPMASTRVAFTLIESPINNNRVNQTSINNRANQTTTNNRVQQPSNLPRVGGGPFNGRQMGGLGSTKFIIVQSPTIRTPSLRVK